MTIQMCEITRFYNICMVLEHVLKARALIAFPFSVTDMVLLLERSPLCKYKCFFSA